MIKAIIFDLGGVLIENPTPGMISYFAALLGVKEEEFFDLDRLPLQAFQKGLISEDTFWEKFCFTLRVKKPDIPSLWQEGFKREFKPRPEMFQLASELKENGYKVGLLSNTEAPSMQYFNEQEISLFDAVVFSCAENTWKPEKRIYEIALAKLGVQPKEAVFIDDRKDFIDGANKVGINTILFTSPTQVREDLAHYSVLRSSAGRTKLSVYIQS